MANIFITSDPHLGHINILKFLSDKGERLRPFDSIDEMHEVIRTRWNAKVKPSDKVYVLGDIAMKKSFIPLISTFNGHKRLVRGNHDIFRTKYYLPFFEEIYAYRKFDNLLLSHIPVHPASLRYDWFNVHGHIHNNLTEEQQESIYGKRYINVSTEVTNYTPLAIEEVLQIARSRFSPEELEAMRNRYKKTAGAEE